MPTTPKMYVRARACAVLSTLVVADPVPVIIPYPSTSFVDVAVMELVVSRSQVKYTGLVLDMRD